MEAISASSHPSSRREFPPLPSIEGGFPTAIAESPEEKNLAISLGRYFMSWLPAVCCFDPVILDLCREMNGRRNVKTLEKRALQAGGIVN